MPEFRLLDRPKVIDYEGLSGLIKGSPLQQAFSGIQTAAAEALSRHGDYTRWLRLFAGLPQIKPGVVELDQPTIRIGYARDCDDDARSRLHHCLQALKPWRKGPFSLFGIDIDTEWRSDLKWARFADSIELEGRKVLDVGCGSGYYCLRMVGAKAGLVIGIDPMPLYVAQFHLLRHFLTGVPAFTLPLALEAFPSELRMFDTVFSMGVLYHRRSPFEHLLALAGCLRPGGDLILETLVVDGDHDTVLVPEGRYAKMRNVWSIPSCLALETWLSRCNFREIRLLDVSVTTPAEQRRTAWMEYESLADFLDPLDPGRTIEGYPAPKRAVFSAVAP